MYIYMHKYIYIFTFTYLDIYKYIFVYLYKIYLHIYIYDIYLPISLFKFIFIHIVLFHKRIQYITRFLKTFKTMVLQRCLREKTTLPRNGLDAFTWKEPLRFLDSQSISGMSTDILEREPEPPRLNLLVPRSDFYPMVPQNLMQA